MEMPTNESQKNSQLPEWLVTLSQKCGKPGADTADWLVNHTEINNQQRLKILEVLGGTKTSLVKNSSDVRIFLDEICDGDYEKSIAELNSRVNPVSLRDALNGYGFDIDGEEMESIEERLRLDAMLEEIGRSVLHSRISHTMEIVIKCLKRVDEVRRRKSRAAKKELKEVSGGLGLPMVQEHLVEFLESLPEGESWFPAILEKWSTDDSVSGKDIHAWLRKNFRDKGEIDWNYIVNRTVPPELATRNPFILPEEETQALADTPPIDENEIVNDIMDRAKVSEKIRTFAEEMVTLAQQNLLESVQGSLENTEMDPQPPADLLIDEEKIVDDIINRAQIPERIRAFAEGMVALSRQNLLESTCENLENSPTGSSAEQEKKPDRENEALHPKNEGRSPREVQPVKIKPTLVKKSKKRGPLTKEGEIELADRRDAGDETVINELVTGSLPLVKWVALKFKGQGVEYEDLVNEGVFGLIRAAKKFDKKKEVRFTTYAKWWVRASMQRAIATIGIPRHIVTMLNKIRQAESRLINVEKVEPTTEGIAERAGLSTREVENARIARKRMVSFNAPFGGDPEGGTYENLIGDDSIGDIVDISDRAQCINLILDEIEKFSPRERAIIRLRYGLDDGVVRTLGEVSKIHGVSKRRIEQILVLTRKKIRASLIQKLGEKEFLSKVF